MTGWLSHNDVILDVNGTTNAYLESMRQLNHSLGLGIRGTPTEKLEVGGDLTVSYEVNRYGQGVNGVSNQPNNLPAVAFRQLGLTVFGKYALDKSADVRVSLSHQRTFFNEWYWSNNGVPFFISDGTTVNQKDNQHVTAIGASYIYKWQ
jgi:hypothetical protein